MAGKHRGRGELRDEGTTEGTITDAEKGDPPLTAGELRDTSARFGAARPRARAGWLIAGSLLLWPSATGGLGQGGAGQWPSEAVSAPAFGFPEPTAAIVLPAGFVEGPVASVGMPTGLAFTPDGRLLVTTQRGRLRVVQNGSLVGTPALDLAAQGRVCSDSERGLLGVAVSPDFATSKAIFLYYTFKSGTTCVNRVSRFTLSDLNAASGEIVLLDNIPSVAGNHNGGDLQFGKDGLLYVSVGDGGCDYAGDSGCGGANDAARDRHVSLGKILRITRTGAIPASNPFQGANSGRCNITGRTTAGNWCRETFASGLRNPFRMAFDPNASGVRFYINDVGQNDWEEIDLGAAGADYGWNLREGSCPTGQGTGCGPPPAGLTDPVYAYDHDEGCKSISGGAFVPRGAWPISYDAAYLFSDFVCGKIFRLVPNGSGGVTVTTFASGLGGSSAVALAFGPFGQSQALYYATYAGGAVRRIAFTGNVNRSPVAAAAANPAFGPLPLTVSLSAAGSSDPDGDPLTYSWKFGDGSPAASGKTVGHIYTAAGTFTATVTVRDNRGGLGTASVRVDPGHTPPQATFIRPSTRPFFVGQTILLQAKGTDETGRALPDSAFTWEVRRHHDTHFHPWFGPVRGNDLRTTAPAPEDLAATLTSHLEVRLTATDLRGLSRTLTRLKNPHLVDLKFATGPVNLRLTVNELSFTAPFEVTSWEGWRLTIAAANQTDGSGRSWSFVSWSDGKAATHEITTPSSAKTYKATFRNP